MANETPAKPTTPFTVQTPAPVQAQGQVSIENITNAISQLGQMQADLITDGIKSATAVFEPLSKFSLELASNLLNSFNQVLQNLSASIEPKK